MDNPHSSEDLSIPTHSDTHTPTTLRCCCGRNDCALLEHNNVALEGLEKDLETAARLGQALLHRHESYMAEAEEDRHRLVANIDDLEREKKQVQAENARIIEENRSLLEQLDSLNQAVAESDTYAKSLEVRLNSTESELRRLTVAAARAEELEIQVAFLEAEESKLQETLMSVQEDEKSAVQRWRQAETTLRDLHDQVDRIEKEAREERERHTELVQRMERKRAVERELDNAAGRLKGAAAASELNRGAGGTTVVSRFVKDILQDNANLQVGIMELRDMLQSSNEEVQNLREQVISHQPLAGIDEDSAQQRSFTTLSEELEAKEERRVSQELHIHHHFHTPTAAPKKEKGTLNRRVKKRRPALASPIALHSARSHSPRRAIHRSQSSGSSMSTILSHTSVSIPPHSSSRRYSLQSHAPDSLASSPRSAYRTSSIFDRVECAVDFSQPTSPGSTVFSSPLMTARTFQGLDGPFRAICDDSHDPPDDLSALEDGPYRRQDFSNMGDNREPAIPEESESSPSGAYFPSAMGEQEMVTEDEIFPMHVQSSSLHRSSSHDSLLSVAGMDIHTPNNRHARMGDWHPGMRIPRRILSPSVQLVSTPPVISAPAITADRAKGSEHSSKSLLASMAAGNSHRSDTASIASSQSTSNASTSTIGPRKAPLSRRVGGWVLGRWGIAAVSSNVDSHDSTESPAESPGVSVASSPSVPSPSMSAPIHPDPLALRFRRPGVNQKGPIMGLRPPPPAPIVIHAQSIDENLLRESLVDETG
ncbi:uncharacterized protein N7515_009099 [Penicillium bovifimosum]|uniref:Uncharacterized protein n=1 Tax=Penicillium bovifimosum TaxID=126998 RepID=A0A9W9GIN1_9EURO|nr:uncharacterized protein N7515_009099 [Penicillium bovifimosum]KAJ5121138.1 hypothetical protein N7515_009099 [Penicillium bovifimosum]